MTRKLDLRIFFTRFTICEKRRQINFSGHYFSIKKNRYFLFLLFNLSFSRKLHMTSSIILLLNILFRIKNNGSETPTSISVDFFSGYHFVSLSNSDNTKEFWHVTNINHNLVLHVNKVSIGNNFF